MTTTNTASVEATSAIQPAATTGQGGSSSLPAALSRQATETHEGSEEADAKSVQPIVGPSGSPATAALSAASSAAPADYDAEAEVPHTDMRVEGNAEPVTPDMHANGASHDKVATKQDASQAEKTPKLPDESTEFVEGGSQVNIETEKTSEGHKTTLNIEMNGSEKISFDVVNVENKTYVFVPLRQNVQEISPIIKEIIPGCEILQKSPSASVLRDNVVSKDKNAARDDRNGASEKEGTPKNQSFWARVVNISV